MRSDSPLRGLRLVAELAKLKITIGVTLTVALGYFLFAESASWEVLPPMLGVFLLACGSSTLNHIQDARIDALMTRTRNRPIPSGRIDRAWALFVAMVFVAAGLYVLASIERHTLELLALGALALFWYNGVYTPLKRVTAFAVVPGALIGAIPPVMGWVAAGGLWWDPVALEVAFFLFLWQIPHFWCLVLMKGRDYERAGLPALMQVLSRPQIERVTSMWILALAAAGLVLAQRFDLAAPWHLGMLAASLWLAWTAFAVLRARRGPETSRPAFLRVNLYLLAVLGCMSGNALV